MNRMQWNIMLSELEIKRIYWASRRGMLELDLMLVPYADARLREMAKAEQERFQRFLESEDTELFAWFLGREIPEDPEFAELVRDIIAFARQEK